MAITLRNTKGSELTHAELDGNFVDLDGRIIDLTADKLDATHAGTGGAAHAAATTSVAGFLSGADKTKLDGIAAGATANATDAQLRDRQTHTGTQLASTISDFSEAVDDRVSTLLVPGSNVTVSYNDGTNTITLNTVRDGTTNLSFTRDTASVTVISDTGTDAILPAATTTNAGVLTGADKTKLDGIAAGATANATDAQLRDRQTHTGTQLASTISDFSAAVRATTLSGLGAQAATLIAATDTVLEALAKLQAQITAIGGGGGPAPALGELQYGGETLEFGGVALEFTA